MTVVQIEWRDHYSVYGWFPPEDVTPVGHINVSVGYVVSETEEYTTLAQTMHQDRDQYADLIHIINKEIISYKELK